jgi:hypothetical protein
MTAREQVECDIETARMRHDWAVAERERLGSTPALETFIEESGKELAYLAGKSSKAASTQL